MSRTGNKPVKLPEKVKVSITDDAVLVEGPLGKLQQSMFASISLKAENDEVIVSRKDDSIEARQKHGLMRSLVQNLVQGVSEGFKKSLTIHGVGYRADVKGKVLVLSLGFSHPVEYQIPEGINIEVEKQTKITVSGVDKALVGQVAANIRDYRGPEPYKGKGVRYEDEQIQRKAGKSGAK